MKKILTTLLIIGITTLAFPQATIDHPIKLIDVPVEAQEFVIFHTDYSSTSSLRTTLGSYDYTAANANISISEDNSYLNPQAVKGFRSVNAISVNYDGDMYDEVVQISETTNGFVISFPQMSNDPLKTDSVTRIFFNNIGRTSGSDEPTLKLAKADFDNDGKEEFVLAFRNYNTEKIAIHIRNVDESSNGTTRLGINAEVDFDPIGGGFSEFEAFDIIADDFDGDGIPDIALANMRDTASDRATVLHIFKVETGALTKDNWNIVKSGEKYVYFNNDGYNDWGNVSITSGRFDTTASTPNQIALASVMENPEDENQLIRRLDVIEVDNIGSGTFSSSIIDSKIYSPNNFNYFPGQSIASGDLNGDGNDEIVWARDGDFQVFTLENSLIKSKASASGAYEEGALFDFARNGNYLSVGDVNWDNENDILLVTSFVDQDDSEQYLHTTIFSANQSLSTLTKKGDADIQVENNCGNSCSYRYAGVLGEFRGGRGYLREPSKITRKIITPLIINNAPPHHFDIINGVEADITDVFPNWPAEMNSQYEAITSESFTLETELKSDWAVSSTLSGGGSAFGVGVETSLTATYGEEFSETQMNTEKVIISTLSTAKSDDQIYGLVQDFDIYEYPVEDIVGNKIGYVLALIRKGTPIIQWMDSKSTDALEYIPSHETGNILSYPATDNFNEYTGLDKLVKQDGGFNFGSGGALNFIMTFSDFSSTSASNTQSFGMEINSSASYFGTGLEVNGSYNSSEMTTHTSAASSDISFISNLNHSINPQYSDANYTITPNVFWAKNGALTLDYAVDPSLPGGSTNNFWSDNYTTKPDLTLILPWKYDPEKGFSLGSTPDKRRLSKSITLSADYYLTGDTVTISAFIQNYSFADYTGDVEFQFYAGNPDNGGQLLSDIDGNNTLTVTDFFPGRDRTQVNFQWKVPSGIGGGNPFYVVIDPNDLIAEIHEDNNVGFYGAGSSSVGIEAPELTKQTLSAKLYPNPATTWTQLELEMPLHGDLQVELIDMQGRMIKTLFNEDLSKGKYILPIDLSTVESGYYLVRMRIGNQQKTLKLVKVD